jgi:hypothetical protein
MNSTLVIIGVIILALAVIIFVPQWRMMRAVRQVIRIFRAVGATDASTGKTLDELGLKPRSFMEGLLKGRDYKQYAVQSLLKAEIVLATGDGRFYLSEEKILSSGLSKRL